MSESKTVVDVIKKSKRFVTEPAVTDVLGHTWAAETSWKFTSEPEIDLKTSMLEKELLFYTSNSDDTTLESGHLTNLSLIISIFSLYQL